MDVLKVPNDSFYKYNSYKSTGSLIPKCRSEAMKQKRASIRSKIHMLAKQIYQLRDDAQVDAYNLRTLANKADVLIDQANTSLKKIEYTQQQFKQQIAILNPIQQKAEQDELIVKIIGHNQPILQPICFLQRKVKDQGNFPNSDRSTQFQFQIHNNQLSDQQKLNNTNNEGNNENSQNSGHQMIFSQNLSKYEKKEPQQHFINLKNRQIKHNMRVLCKNSSSISYVNFMLNSLLTIILLSVILILIN